MIQDLSDIAFSELLLTLLVAKKRLISTYNIWIRPRINANDRSDGSVIHKYLDADMERFEKDYQTRPRGDCAVPFLMMSILRFTSFSTLCVAVGLRRGSQSKAHVLEELRGSFSADGTRSRLTLLYAGQLFAHFRPLRTVPRCDLQAFLASALYIFAWTLLATPSSLTADAALERPQSSDSVRIDQGSEGQIAQRWISDAAGFKAQLTGVGVLAGSEAAARVLKESARILKTKASVSTLGRSMADQLVRIALGG